MTAPAKRLAYELAVAKRFGKKLAQYGPEHGLDHDADADIGVVLDELDTARESLSICYMQGSADATSSMRKQLSTAQALNKRSLEMLREREWDGDNSCAGCGRYRTHDPDCTYVALIRDLEAVMEPMPDGEAR